ncbi:hypothetical protein PMAYCL1PPCAC_24722, partial [Pristionchus mayeri]
DTNLAKWRIVNRMITSKYFVYSERSTGCASFDVFHSFYTLMSEIENKPNKTNEEHILNKRIVEDLAYNAYFYRKFNSILLLAPFFYPLMRENSSDITMLGYGALLGHEIFHSFITDDMATRSTVYHRERSCISNHFENSCTFRAEGSCYSGMQTVNEDAPDLEG